MFTLYEQTAADLTRLVEAVTEQDLERPTPCEGWDVRRLLAHQLGEQHGFARALVDGAASPAAFERATVAAAELPSEWARSSTALRTAFENTPADRLVGLAAYGELTAAVVLRMQLLDTAVHAWDLSSALGGSYRPADAVVADVLRFARRIAAREQGSTAFAAPITSGAGVDDWATALRLLGRSCGDDGRWLRR